LHTNVIHLSLPSSYCHHPDLHSFPTRRSSDLPDEQTMSPRKERIERGKYRLLLPDHHFGDFLLDQANSLWELIENFRRILWDHRSEEHTSELQSHLNLVCRLLLEKKKQQTIAN